MLGDIQASTSIIVVLTLAVLTILVLGIFNLFQLARMREMREDIRELRYYLVQVSRRANVDLNGVTAPERLRLPFVDRARYWRNDQDASFTFPGHAPGGRWARAR